jgi:hypothetical protein
VGLELVSGAEGDTEAVASVERGVPLRSGRAGSAPNNGRRACKEATRQKDLS